MRLKKILLEEDKKDNVRRECSLFIERNLYKLKNENYLLRGTDKKYDGSEIVKKDPRQRRSVKGSKRYTWLYERFRPDDHPSREDMVPSFNSDSLGGTFGMKNVFSVFPIGKNYKLQYAYGVEDFNSFNPYFEVDPRLAGIITTAIGKYGEEVPRELEMKAKNVLESLSNKDKISNEYSHIMWVYNRAWEVIKKLAKETSKDESHDVKSIEELKEEVEDQAESYFENSIVSKEIPSNANLEVNIYAPNGFYYVNKHLVDDIIKEDSNV